MFVRTPEEGAQKKFLGSGLSLWTSVIAYCYKGGVVTWLGLQVEDRTEKKDEETYLGWPGLANGAWPGLLIKMPYGVLMARPLIKMPYGILMVSAQASYARSLEKCQVEFF